MKQIELFKNLCRHLKKKMLIGALMLFISNIIYAQNTTVHGIITDELKTRFRVPMFPSREPQMEHYQTPTESFH